MLIFSLSGYNTGREVLTMWEFVNGMANGVRHRMMPRRRNGVGTMTAMMIGASVGIAAWETVRRSRNTNGSGNAEKLAEQVMQRIED